MNEELKKVTYHIEHDDAAPEVGQYFVFLGKKGVLSVHLIRTVRKVVPRVISECAKYALQLKPQPHLIPYTEFERRYHGTQVWVRGEPALPSYWMPRGKPKADVN